MEVLVVDYGLGNLKSIQRALEHENHSAFFCADPNVIQNHPIILLPGVGAFHRGVANLRELGVVEALRSRVDADLPILGICLGMQLLFDSSEEGSGNEEGLGIIPGSVARIPDTLETGESRVVPHVGWNEIIWDDSVAARASLFVGDPKTLLRSAYFTHSYAAQPKKRSNVKAQTNVGGLDVCAVVANGSTLGFQFHPEKSGLAGVRFLSRALMNLTK